ncbi:hypothetical protein EIP91_009065 [Steccherinum ochraceum]|uniref:Uncharacterized protein n=1 Tax=Steccherinum ochraceum TaxID=92696 RepID=A0A4R0R229_9APHY|nr:hypothetical protein EIP91_009065 [Steccherinum ochraceum]
MRLSITLIIAAFSTAVLAAPIPFNLMSQQSTTTTEPDESLAPPKLVTPGKWVGPERRSSIDDVYNGGPIDPEQYEKFPWQRGGCSNGIICG